MHLALYLSLPWPLPIPQHPRARIAVNPKTPFCSFWPVHQLFRQHHPQDHQLVCGSNCGAPPRCTCAPPPSLVSRRLPCGHARKWNPGAPVLLLPPPSQTNLPGSTHYHHHLPHPQSTFKTAKIYSPWSQVIVTHRAGANVMTPEWVSSARQLSAGIWRRPHCHTDLKLFQSTLGSSSKMYRMQISWISFFAQKHNIYQYKNRMLVLVPLWLKRGKPPLHGKRKLHRHSAVLSSWNYSHQSLPADKAMCQEEL